MHRDSPRKTGLYCLVTAKTHIIEPAMPVISSTGLDSILAPLYTTVRDALSGRATRQFNSFGEEVVFDDDNAYSMFLEDKEEIGLFISSCSPNDIFYDIGAGVGEFTCAVGVHLPDGEVHSFEPSDRVELLDTHRSMNGISGDIHQVVVGESSRRGLNKYNIATETDDIPVISIDSIVSDGTHPPDLMKIDVEGAEIEVLDGMHDVLTKNPPRLLTVEVHPHLRKHVTVAAVTGRLARYGYRFDEFADTGDITTIIAYLSDHS